MLVEAGGRVIFVVSVDPFLIYIFIGYELFYFSARSVLSWFLVTRWQSCFPISVHDYIVNILVEFYHFRLPLVQVN